MFYVIQINPHFFIIKSLLRHACLAWLYKKCVFVYLKTCSISWIILFYYSSNNKSFRRTNHSQFTSTCIFLCASLSLFGSCWTIFNKLWLTLFFSFTYFFVLFSSSVEGRKEQNVREQNQRREIRKLLFARNRRKLCCKYHVEDIHKKTALSGAAQRFLILCLKVSQALLCTMCTDSREG